ncbi:retrovirus-related pol polyprotein from transposon TNT 1-94 [Tanacetum coccineum]
MALLAQSFRATLPQTNNQLRTSSNTRNQATIQDGNGGAQNRAGNAHAGQGKPVKCYNCNGVGHIARNCTQLKRLHNFDYFKDKMLLMQAQENGAVLDEEELLFLAGEQGNTFDTDVDNQPIQDLALNEDNIFQADECDAFDSDVNDEPTAQSIFMANLSSVRSANPQAGPSNASILSEDGKVRRKVRIKGNITDEIGASAHGVEVRLTVEIVDVVPIEGFCLFCASRDGNSSIDVPNLNSFNDPSNVFTHPPQPKYESYSCELCGNDAHYDSHRSITPQEKAIQICELQKRRRNMDEIVLFDIDVLRSLDQEALKELNLTNDELDELWSTFSTGFKENYFSNFVKVTLRGPPLFSLTFVYQNFLLLSYLFYGFFLFLSPLGLQILFLTLAFRLGFFLSRAVGISS